MKGFLFCCKWVNAMIKMPSSSPSASGACFWEQRYHEGATRWDIGQPAPAFVKRLQPSEPLQPGQAIAPGSDPGHDALMFTASGFEVVGVDYVKKENEPI